MKELSRVVSSIPPSETLAVSDKAKALKAAGYDVVALAGGDPDFDTPPNIRAAGTAAIEAGKTRYTAVSGIADLRAAIAERSTAESTSDGPTAPRRG